MSGEDMIRAGVIMREAAESMRNATDMSYTILQLQQVLEPFTWAIDKLAKIAAIQCEVDGMKAECNYTEESFYKCQKQLEDLA